MGSVGSTTDAFNGSLGPRKNMSDSDKEDVLDRIFMSNIVNPNYERVYTTENYEKFHRNCALCTTAAALQLMGYDVEALARDKEWRGPSDVFDVDYNNPDNYIASSGVSLFQADPVYVKDTTLVRTTDKNGNVKYEEKSTPYVQITRKTKDSYNITKITNVDNVQAMPRGAEKASAAIIDKVKGWGNGSFGEITVCWSRTGSGHSMLITNSRGNVQIFDTQNGRMYGTNEIKTLLQSTKANTTTIKRLDNAKIKDTPVVSKMVKRRGNK